MKVVLLFGLVGLIIKCLLVTNFITKFVIDNLVPYDGRPTIVIDTVALLLVTVILLLAVIGAVLAVICLAFNLAYRNTRLYQTLLLLLLLEFIKTLRNCTNKSAKA